MDIPEHFVEFEYGNAFEARELTHHHCFYIWNNVIMQASIQ